MSYQVNQKINPYNQPSMGLNSLPLQNVDSDKVRQGINDSPVVKTTKQDSPLLLLGVMAPTAVGTVWIMSKFNEKCNGEYKTSLVGKIGDFGDKIGSTKLLNNSFTHAINQKYTNICKYLNEKFIPKNKILTAMFKTPTVPENHNVLTMAGGTMNELASSATQLFEKFTEKGANLDKIKQLGFVKANGEADLEKYHDVVKNSHKYPEEILQACQKQGIDGGYETAKGGKLWLPKFISKEDKYLSEMLPFTKKFFCRRVYFSEFTNKMNAVKGIKNTAQTTILGKVLPKTTLRVLEGITNAGTGGGILATLMGSYIIADSIVKTIKADKGDKTKTFAENIIYNLGWYLTLPFAIGLMHKFGGLKYIGMSKEKVAAFRTELEAFNAKAKAGGFTNKKDYDAAKKVLKDMLKGDTKILKSEAGGTRTLKFVKNLIHRPLKWAGRTFTIGIEKFGAFNPNAIGKGSGFAKRFEQVIKHEKGYWFREVAGYPMRLGVYMFLLAPIFGKISAKCSHMIFGKPKHSVLDEGKEDEKDKKQQEAPVQPPVMPKQQTRQIQQPQAVKPVQSVNNVNTAAQPQNLLDSYKATNPQQGAQRPVQQQPVAAKPKTTTPPTRTYTYVPSPAGVKLNPNSDENKQDAKVNVAYMKADNAEKVADKFLGKKD